MSTRKANTKNTARARGSKLRANVQAKKRTVPMDWSKFEADQAGQVKVAFPISVGHDAIQAILDTFSPQSSLAEVTAALSKVGASWEDWNDGQPGHSDRFGHPKDYRHVKQSELNALVNAGFGGGRFYRAVFLLMQGVPVQTAIAQTRREYRHGPRPGAEGDELEAQLGDARFPVTPRARPKPKSWWERLWG